LANQIFNHSTDYSGSTLALGAVLFAFQIYGDFSGYSDIALGTARLFGIDLLRNFAFPYFSRDIAEFWRRWHISLSLWFRDYLYIPLGGSKGGNWMRIRNTYIIFIVSGFWHGANWTFIVWGALNALFITPSILMKTNRNNLETVAQGNLLPTPKEFFQMLLTFGLAVFAWIFFRADSIGHAISYISNMFSPSLFSMPYIIEDGTGVRLVPKLLLILIALFIAIEWLGREQQYAIQNLGLRWKRPLRHAMYYAIIIAIFWFGGKEQQFIYFQF
jgi:D-alanyl-lipoteichoic acid acyltransferase DltB (MBOAT superfamily)